MAWDAAKHPRDPHTGRFIKAGVALSAVRAALRDDGGSSAPKAPRFPKTAAKRGGTDPATVRGHAMALIDAPNSQRAHEIAAGLKGKQLDAVAEALGVTLHSRGVGDKRIQLVEGAIGNALKSVTLRQYDGPERDRFIREHRERSRQRVIDNTGGAAGAPTYGRPTPSRDEVNAARDEALRSRAAAADRKAVARIADAVNASATREEADARLEGLTVPQLRAVAEHMKVPLRGRSKAQMRRDIVGMSTGVARAEFESWRDPGNLDPSGLMARTRSSGTSVPEGGGTVLQFPGAAARRRGRGKARPAPEPTPAFSPTFKPDGPRVRPAYIGATDGNGRIIPRNRPHADEPIYLPNSGKDQGLMHLDSETGQLWRDLYMDDREPNSFVNEIGRLGDALGRDEISLEDLIGRLRHLRVQASDQAVAKRIEQAIDAMDAPAVGVPGLPETVPPAIRRALGELAQIPTARKTGRIGATGTDRSVLDKKVDIVRRIDSGDIDFRTAERELGQRDLHESADGATKMWKIMERLLSPRFVVGYQRNPTTGRQEPVEEPNPDYAEVRAWIRSSAQRART